jgi:hypothetical protein
MRGMKRRQIITQQRVVSRLEYWSFVCGVSVMAIMLFISTLHLSLLFLQWSIL